MRKSRCIEGAKVQGYDYNYLEELSSRVQLLCLDVLMSRPHVVSGLCHFAIVSMGNDVSRITLNHLKTVKWGTLTRIRRLYDSQVSLDIGGY